MGYPVAYRQTALRPEISGFQRKLPGTVLPFPSKSLLNRFEPPPHIEHLREEINPKSLRNIWGIKPMSGSFGPARTSTAIFGKAQRMRNRRALFSAFKGGFKIRSMLFRWLMREVSSRAIELVRRKYMGNPAQAKHPLWNINGRWGLYPYCSGQTGQHLIGSSPIHNFAQTQFGHPWSVGFPWPEYDFVIKPTVGTWQFTVVGLGTQGAGPLPNTFYTDLLKQKVSPWIENRPHTDQNPWHDRGYNPWWNKHHWPEPIPRVNPYLEPMPMWWPEGAPILSPWVQGAPSPLPFQLIPHKKPNRWSSPVYRTNWGPTPTPTPSPDPWPTTDPRTDPKTNPVTVTKTPTRVWRSWSPGNKAPTGYKDKPPGKRVKELKTKMKAFRGSLIYRLMNGATEYQDYVDAIWKTLDRQFKSRGKLRVNDKAMDIYRHLDKIDPEKAIKALVANEIQDFIFGLLGQVSKRTAGKIGSAVDLHGRAMRKGQGQTRDAVNELVTDIMNEVFK